MHAVPTPLLGRCIKGSPLGLAWRPPGERTSLRGAAHSAMRCDCGLAITLALRMLCAQSPQTRQSQLPLTSEILSTGGMG